METTLILGIGCNVWQVDPTKTFDQVVTMEDLSKGQLITGYSIEAHKGGEWKRLKLVGGHGVGRFGEAGERSGGIDGSCHLCCEQAEC